MAPLMDLASIVTSANYRKKINGIKVVSSMQSNSFTDFTLEQSGEF